MEKQHYIIKKNEAFNLEHIFECGQCFRWNKETDGSYTGVIGNNVLNIKKDSVRMTVLRSVRNLKKQIKKQEELI